MKHNAKQMGTVDYADKKNDVDGLGVEGACCLKNKGRKYVTQEYETLLFYSFYSFYSSSVLPLLTPRPAHVFLGVDFYEGSLDDVDPSEWQVPPHCIPIHTNVTSYDWTGLGAACQFDVIMMDPPWQLATANPTAGRGTGLLSAHGQRYRRHSDSVAPEGRVSVHVGDQRQVSVCAGSV